MVAWMLMRISGIGLFLFLVLHLSIIYFCGKDETTLSRFLALKSNPFAKILENLLILTLGYHAVNGLRTILMEAGLKQHRILFILAIGLPFSLSALFWLAVNRW